MVAAIAESLRFFAVAFLASSVGALSNTSVSNLLRYAAVPQLLFPAGFFFLWLDPPRYSSYRPLLTVGKTASVVCLIPLAAALVRDPNAMGVNFGIPAIGLGLTFVIAAIDIASLSILLLVGIPAEPSDKGGPGQPPSKSNVSEEAPGNIEQVEG